MFEASFGMPPLYGVVRGATIPIHARSHDRVSRDGSSSTVISISPGFSKFLDAFSSQASTVLKDMPEGIRFPLLTGDSSTTSITESFSASD